MAKTIQAAGSTASKKQTRVSKPARKAVKKPVRKPSDTRGMYVPLKADKEAFERGDLTPRSRRMNRIVDQGFGIIKRFRTAQVARDIAVEKIHGRYAINGQGFTAVSADGKRRIIIERKNTVAGNQNAIEAKQLIDEYTQELLGRTGTSTDDRQMATFLGGIVTTSRGRILLTRSVVEFRRMQFTDPRLVKAQRLLTDAFEVKESKLSLRCEERIGDDWVAQ